MQASAAYADLLTHIKQTRALGQVAGLLSWDQETMMPPKGAEARAEQAAAVEAALHERRTDPRIDEWLAALDGHDLSDMDRDSAAEVNVRHTRRAYDRAAKIPPKLAEELARVTARAQGIWAQARSANRFEDFAPSLQTIIALKREEAACIASPGTLHYDALLDDFEPGMTVAVLQPLLESLRPRLSDLRQRIADSGVEQPQLTGIFETDAQMKLARKIADVLGYDWEAGRLDLSVHPFSSGTAGDARITTRLDEHDPLGCLYSTIHELGHALYEQGVPQSHALTPAGSHVSMGVHESQSRLWENQIGRSRAFCTWLFPAMKEAFGNLIAGDAEQLYRAVNRVETGFIRTESDEVHYNLHVLLRFELERELIAGELDVEDLESEWNRRFERDFGVAVPDAANGVLQDVHWSVGLFGYFPTYSLGNIYAGQLNAKMRSSLADVDGAVSRGETESVLEWLRKNIHSKGSLHGPAELIERTVGEPVSTEPLLLYLEEKYGEMFDL